MKALSIIGLVLAVLYLGSCKTDVPPTLVITVEDSLGGNLVNARVFTHPCQDGVSCDTSRIEKSFIKSGTTNSSGTITFEYPYSAIIDVSAQWTNCDTPTVYCLSSGKTVARFETKKLKKGEDNIFNVVVTVYPEN
ncbi:MAG: hypothetical protein RIE58_02155 [Vicingaceae bacterium]